MTSKGGGGIPPFAAFLASLILPGAGQWLTGAAARGTLFGVAAALLAGALLAGPLALPGASGFGPPSAVALAALLLLWGSTAYDAWFRARERLNDMLPCLQRTPRVAALASLLWGGAGQVYLGSVAFGTALAAVTAALLGGLAWSGSGWSALLLVAWNAFWGVAAGRRGRLRYHGTEKYAALARRLADAPLESPLAPSPALPLATLVAAFIAVAGTALVVRGVRDLQSPRPLLAASRAGRLGAGTFEDPLHGVRMALPTEGWSFAPGGPPAILAGRRLDGRRSLTLAVARSPLFAGDDVVPAGALERLARREEATLARRLSGFELLSRAPLASGTTPGFRLVFRAGAGDATTTSVQDYYLSADRFVVLTLSTAGSPDTDALIEEQAALAAGLVLKGPRT